MKELGFNEWLHENICDLDLLNDKIASQELDHEGVVHM
jgi:hypothetical protein